mmetsp:Transcript_1509/g.2606  ORF Transcript_1509/g.2606 Transcript_1509/m.2606 type:complete len:211 (-) Transcript_1509:142-774(-)
MISAIGIWKCTQTFVDRWDAVPRRPRAFAVAPSAEFHLSCAHRPSLLAATARGWLTPHTPPTGSAAASLWRLHREELPAESSCFPPQPFPSLHCAELPELPQWERSEKWKLSQVSVSSGKTFPNYSTWFRLDRQNVVRPGRCSVATTVHLEASSDAVHLIEHCQDRGASVRRVGRYQLLPGQLRSTQWNRACPETYTNKLQTLTKTMAYD